MEAVAGHTWGISGPMFLLLYTSAVAGVLAAIAVRRHAAFRLTRDDLLRLDAYEVAMINGGERLVAVVALAGLDRSGSVALGHHMLRDLAEHHGLDIGSVNAAQLDDLGLSVAVTLLEPPPTGVHPVESAVYEAAVAADPRTPEAVIKAATGHPDMVKLRRRMGERGLVDVAGTASWCRHQAWWFLPVTALGVLRIQAGVSRGKPVSLLLLLLAVTAVIAVRVAVQPDPTTGYRRRAVTELRVVRRIPPLDGVGDHHLHGMALALFGAGALWAHDRALALALGATGPREGLVADHRHPAIGGGGGRGGCGGCGCCGGGCGGGCGG